MMLDADPAKLTKTGEVIINRKGISVNGFSGKGCSCRDVAALGIVWAIGELQKELKLTLEAPGKSHVCVD